MPVGENRAPRNRTKGKSVASDETQERLKNLEEAMAVQTATQAGAQATQAAAQAGMAATMVAGAVALVAGMPLGFLFGRGAARTLAPCGSTGSWTRERQEAVELYVRHEDAEQLLEDVRADDVELGGSLGSSWSASMRRKEKSGELGCRRNPSPSAPALYPAQLGRNERSRILDGRPPGYEGGRGRVAPLGAAAGSARPALHSDRFPRVVQYRQTTLAASRRDRPSRDET